MRDSTSLERTLDRDRGKASPIRRPFLRVLPSAIAIIPVSMLFGVLAHRAGWSILEILAAGLLGFTGSGQFALLPLAEANASFLTMLIICASINSRYFPISFTTTERLPKTFFARTFVSQMLGDEAYATERNSDTVKDTLSIRLTIFVFWVVSGVIGAMISKIIPNAWLSTDIHLGFPASVVLIHLSVSQIKMRVSGIYLMQLVMMATCLLLAAAFYSLLGPTYFWIPSVIITAVILDKWGKHE